MRGDIDVESEPGKGTKITVSIPLAHDKEPPDNKTPSTTPAPNNPPETGAVKTASAIPHPVAIQQKTTLAIRQAA